MLINSLHLKNILSFKDTKLDLQPLNVLIGANGSGKSNLIDVIALLQAVPNDLAGFLRRNGPTGDWIWDGAGRPEAFFDPVEITANLGTPTSSAKYELQIAVDNDRVESLTEKLGFPHTESDGKEFVSPVFRASRGDVRLWSAPPISITAERNSKSTQVEIAPDKSVLSEIRHSTEYPAITVIARDLSAMKIYRGWEVGRNSAVRHPQRTDGDPNFLEEDFSNLALVVNDLLSRKIEPSLNDYLKRFYESYESLHTRIFGNTVELIVNETGMTGALPASRLSDGTIRFIALLAILCHPNPPPLICIEEPEIAMHPDSQDLVVEMLHNASERTQLIVTTHSPWLIDRLSAKPEQVVVCERDRHPADGTQFKRFTRKDLKDWLEDQPLGEVWMAGAMGGVH